MDNSHGRHGRGRRENRLTSGRSVDEILLYASLTTVPCLAMHTRTQKKGTNDCGHFERLYKGVKAGKVPK